VYTLGLYDIYFCSVYITFFSFVLNLIISPDCCNTWVQCGIGPAVSIITSAVSACWNVCL